MNNIATLTAQPQILRVEDKEYKVYPLTFADLGALQVWIDSQYPDPFDAVARAIKSNHFNFAQQQFLLDKAIEKATQPKRLIGSPEADELLMSAEGYKQVLILSIRKGDPSFSDDDAKSLFDRMTPADVAKFQSLSNLDMVANDPKDIAPSVTKP